MAFKGALLGIFAVLCAVSAEDMSTQYERTAHQMSELLRIRQQMQRFYSPFSPELAQTSEVRTLGDTAEVEPPAIDTHGRTYALLQLGRALRRFDDQVGDLGEPQQTRKHGTTDDTRLRELLRVPGDGQSTEAVSRLAYFLNDERSKHHSMTRKQLDAVRQFYIDQTADTLARYGYEDSSYGEHDVSIRRGDAVAAHQHMNEEDVLMHSDDASAGPSSTSLKHVVKHLKETVFLSDFLDRLTQDTRQIEEIPVNTDNSELEALQSDEESITSGIEKLLKSIKSGQSMSVADIHDPNSASTAPTGDLEQRATTEATRLARLKRELEAQDQSSTKALQHAASVRVPLPKLREHLDRYISAELDQTVDRFKSMRGAGATVDPALRAKIEKYMSLITAHVLHTCVSYEQWDQPRAVTDELSAVRDGDASALSRQHTGAQLQGSKIVKAFMRELLQPKSSSVAVPYSLQAMTGPGVHLPGGGRLVVTLKQP
eukprot:TRINITY_DN152_c0_g1_i1.p1 TRINITY_DN152_c0_g1~~TRINITY_DN152_c0_g1_i1.p1  ORF type:complete len:486 (+),score=133.45 TRINITY_DN152_c0_g1_i1:185-1642(+)